MRWVKLLLIILVFFCHFKTDLIGQEERKSLPAVRIAQAPTIDGQLKEELWQRLPLFTGFVQYNPYNGQPPSQKTEVRMGYDDRAIYIGAICYDQTPDKIMKAVSIRDQIPAGGNTDMIGILISPYNDGLNSVFFIVTAAGVQRDVKIFGDEHEITWDAVWESSVTMNEDGWVVEMRIPMSCLRFSSRQIQDWGINIWRWIARKRMWAHWNLVDINYPGWWKKMGEWQGLKNLNSPLRLSLTPYISGYFDFQTGQRSEFLYNGGMDLKYGITDSFTLDSTLVPDFGQVQSDDVELNLSPYEIKYNEKRQFFTEGTELFNKGDLFYSRRIGKQPVNYDRVDEDLQGGEKVVKNPQESRLINATKISGRTNFGLGIGVLNAMTARTWATILNSLTGGERDIVTQPFTNYNLMVLDQTLFSHSYIALINSNVSRKDYQANVTAMDFKLADSSNSYSLAGIFAYSRISPDQSVRNGYKLLLNGGKIGGGLKVVYNLSVLSDQYDQNDLGYLRRNNEVINQLSLTHHISKPFACFLSLNNHFQLVYSRLFEPSVFTEFFYNYQVSANFKNHYQLGFRFEHAPRFRHDYFEPRVAGWFFRNSKYYKYGIFAQTDPRRRFWMEASYDRLDSYDYPFNSQSYWVHLMPHLTINDHLTLSWELTLQRYNEELGYVDHISEQQAIIFGKRDRKTTVNTLETSYIFNNKFSLTLRLRHYHSKAVYDSFYQLKQNGELEPSTYTQNPNVNYNAFNIDCTLRWNFAPGSEIFLNWKNAVYTTDQLTGHNYWRNFDDTLAAPHQNSISLKILYYFDF